MASEGLTSISSTNITEHPNTYLTIFLEFCAGYRHWTKSYVIGDVLWGEMKQNKGDGEWECCFIREMSGKALGGMTFEGWVDIFIRWPRGEEGIPGWLGQYK